MTTDQKEYVFILIEAGLYGKNDLQYNRKFNIPMIIEGANPDPNPN